MINRKMLLASVAAITGCFAAIEAVEAGQGYYISNSETTFSLGIQYDFGDRQVDLVAAARRTKTDIENDVTGAKIDITIPLTGDTHLPTARVLGLMGSTDLYGEAGFGYDFAKSQGLISAGAQGPYVNGGINYYFSGLLAPYIGINTLDGAPERIDVLN